MYDLLSLTARRERESFQLLGGYVPGCLDGCERFLALCLGGGFEEFEALVVVAAFGVALGWGLGCFVWGDVGDVEGVGVGAVG